MEKQHLKDDYKSSGEPSVLLNERLNQFKLMLFTLNARTNCSLLETTESLPLFTWMILNCNQ